MDGRVTEAGEDGKVIRGRKELERRAIRDCKVTKAIRGCRAIRDCKAHKATKDYKVFRAIKGGRERRGLVIKALWGL